MSRLPKIPTKSKEKEPSAHNVGRTLCSGMSYEDKRKLIRDHTRPIRGAPSTSALAPLYKRAETVPGPSVPFKPYKVEKKTTVPPKIPTYDYRARFNDLLEKHKVLKNDFNDIKEKYSDVSDNYEKIKDSVHSCTIERDTLKEKLEKSLQELSDKCAENDKLKNDYEILNHEKEDWHCKTKLLEGVTNSLKQKTENLNNENEDLRHKTKVLDDVTNSLKQKTSELDRIESNFNDLNRNHTNLRKEHDALWALTEHLKNISKEYEKLQDDYKKALESITKNKDDAETPQNIYSMSEEQRDLRNTIQDLKGNIRVYCRVRPPLQSELTKPLFNSNVQDACSIQVENIELMNSNREVKHSFSFNRIFTPHANQEDVFAEVSAMVQSALEGYNVCIFAFGQTGSGKTYTMEGGCEVEQYGIIPRSFNMIFMCMEDLKRMGWELTIRASFLEIYNEIIYDLLNSSKDQTAHEIKMVESKGTDVYVSNLKEEEVKSSQDSIRLLICAQCNRQTAATLNNERSSRSHSVVQIKISAINEKLKKNYTSNLNLVDLAGSESGKTTQKMDETKHINRSLSELSKVITCLQTNQSDIPYGNTKLTHLLMPSLGGNSKTLMLVNINQFDECFGETLNSLRFATKVNSFRTINAKKNLSMVDS